MKRISPFVDRRPRLYVIDRERPARSLSPHDGGVAGVSVTLTLTDRARVGHELNRRAVSGGLGSRSRSTLGRSTTGIPTSTPDEVPLSMSIVSENSEAPRSTTSATTSGIPFANRKIVEVLQDADSALQIGLLIELLLEIADLFAQLGVGMLD